MVFWFGLVFGGKGKGLRPFGAFGSEAGMDGLRVVPVFVDVVCQEGREKEKERPENDAEGKGDVVVGHGGWRGVKFYLRRRGISHRRTPGDGWGLR